MGLIRTRAPTAAEKKALHRVVRVGLWGIALVLFVTVIGPERAWVLGLAIGIGLSAHGLISLRRAARVRSWLRAPARVLSTSVGEVAVPGRVSMHTHYHPVVEFEYATTRGRFTARGYAIPEEDPLSLDPDDVRALLHPYPDGAEISVYVSPDDHTRAVVHPGLSRRRRSHYIAEVVGGLLVCAVAVLAALPAGAV